MSRRFNIDPRAPSAARPPPPPPPTPAVTPSVAPLPLGFSPPPGAPPPTTAAPAAAAPAPQSRRKVAIIAAAVIALLLVGGAIAIYAATELGYPNKYVLEDGDMPSGVSNARMSPSDLDEAGMRENPGMMDPGKFREEFGGQSDAEEAHAQVLADRNGARILVLALKYADEDAAVSAAAREGRALCSFASGAALRDGDVLLLVLPDGAPPSTVGSVVRALKEQVPALTQVCGPR